MLYDYEKTINALTGIRKGACIGITREKHLENKKALKEGLDIRKVSSFVGRVGIKYANTKAAKEAEAKRLAQGLEKKEKALWFSHIEENPFIIRNVKDPTKHYIQLFPFGQKRQNKATYYLNGKEISKEALLASGYVNPSELKANEDCSMMAIPLDSIREIRATKRIKKSRI